MSVASLFFIFAGLVVIEVPIAFALIAATMTFLTIASPLPLTIVAQRMVSGLDSFPLLAMPLFILAGNLMNRAGLASRIFAFALSLLGHIRGSLAHVNIGSSIIFAGMSGVAQADAAGLGTVEVRAMRKAGFDPAFAAAVTAASSIIGPIIPPSVIMVIYAVIAQVSVSDLFLAGILPGLLMGGFMMLMVWVLAVTGRIHAPVRPRATAREIGRTFMAALPSLLAPVILIAGLLSGAATPTELGALTVVYAIGVGFVQGELTLEGLRRSVIETGVTAGVLIFIIAAAIPFGWVVSINNLPAQLATTLLGLSNDPNVILLLVNLILLVAGLVMETTAILLIAVPALLPLALALNIDLVHFGVVVVLNLLIGATTPPFGVLLFIMMDIAKVSLGRLVIAMLPFYVALLGALLVVTFWPSFVLFLPNLLGR
ncbi:tripartite ATP-independent transporter DctM subunit [Skermanella aerolata]|uniref:TRAP transporter large permease protein n=1 Tax=Skermanella aerolata TaxID=393310 RepID=A0A512DNF5_9PROT|nr:TRAP transporter large permease [Skermanella aerolata]KJB94421.1 C4-dicarboxylate ABC transporter permease [Skermanella aerolata KACC 11604]GEO38012.1 ABC transporter permease [Skermanella aerolata]